MSLRRRGITLPTDQAQIVSTIEITEVPFWGFRFSFAQWRLLVSTIKVQCEWLFETKVKQYGIKSIVILSACSNNLSTPVLRSIISDRSNPICKVGALRSLDKLGMTYRPPKLSESKATLRADRGHISYSVFFVS